ncbi:hypothetical protein ADL22_15570 [Streptomyces sp. NRRL F-4489]|uniref:DUF742 domain-containing protein n=1 Tax=Streptomyces sp. NRRL F-4489 TaxID=1609095 RepID=UPI00074768E7|nr:DUF742 domain-containing protein [Streptomyces sp. NRRL F-4489]KUL39847.1 hypothetical protein ADL22_15570 [Streptomyces sp. NRRL F-4489]
MATPPSGYPYGPGPQSGPQGETHHNRFNFPSAPSRRPQRHLPPQPQQPAQQRGPYEQRPYEPAPYEPPRPPRIQPVQPPRPAPEPAPTGGANNPLVRPYAMTGGRTRPRYQLAIEALVSTTADPAKLQGQLPEHQRICHLCREIKSVAEISALLSIPLGVARILVADLAEAGLVAIHQPGGDETAGGQPDVTLLERVLSGLRKL